MNHITIYNVDNPIPPKLFDSLFALMEQSFPACERRGKAEHYAEFDKTQFHSLCYCPKGLAGFMNYWDFGEFVFLEHFAVSPSLRGNGIGAMLMEQLKAAVQCPIVLEAEPEEIGEIALRRTRFYKRLGFHVNEYEYYQPPISDNEQPVPLKLLSYPLPFSDEDFLNVRNILYTMAYKVGESWKPKGKE